MVRGLGSLTGICSHKQIGFEMCVEGGDGEPSKFVEIVQIRKTFCGQRH